MNSTDTLLEVDRVWKKYCRNLRRAMWYGVCDISRQLSPIRFPETPKEKLRPGEFYAVKDVSFRVGAGECVGLIGPNGAGKSSLLKMVNGLIRPDSGQIRIRGRVGALIELGTGFNPQLSGRENIFINGTVLGLRRAEIEGAFDQIVEFADLAEVIDDPIKTYSSGMRMRLGFSVAANLRPQLLILDEVLAVGDVRFRMKCFQHFNTLVKQGTSIVLVTHAVNMLPRVATRVIVCDNGKIAFDGPVQEGITVYEQGLLEQASKSSVQQQVWHSAFVAEAVTLDEQGESAEEFSTGDTLRLKIRLQAEQPVPGARLTVSLSCPAQQSIASISSPHQGFHFDLPVGETTIQLELARLPLLLGAYFFEISLYGPELVDFCHRKVGAAPFRIVSPPINVSGNGISGLIEIPHSWRHL